MNVFIASCSLFLHLYTTIIQFLYVIQIVFYDKAIFLRFGIRNIIIKFSSALYSQVHVVINKEVVI